MEDGIERSTVSYEEEKDSKREKCVYIFLPSNGNYIIFFDKDKAIEYSQKIIVALIFLQKPKIVFTLVQKIL